jgi:carboxylesterase
VIGGLSMGGALALRLAEEKPDVAGLALVNPAIVSGNRLVPFARYMARVIPTVASIESDIAKPGVSENGYDRTPVAGVATMHELWRVVRRDLGKVTAPLLLFRSEVDHVVPARSSRIILGEVSSTIAVERRLPNSFHVATLDWDAPTIFAETRDFVRVVTEPDEPTEQSA